jgi:hypothetical protein
VFKCDDYESVDKCTAALVLCRARICRKVKKNPAGLRLIKACG